MLGGAAKFAIMVKGGGIIALWCGTKMAYEVKGRRKGVGGGGGGGRQQVGGRWQGRHGWLGRCAVVMVEGGVAGMAGRWW